MVEPSSTSNSRGHTASEAIVLYSKPSITPSVFAKTHPQSVYDAIRKTYDLQISSLHESTATIGDHENPTKQNQMIPHYSSPQAIQSKFYKDEDVALQHRWSHSLAEYVEDSDFIASAHHMKELLKVSHCREQVALTLHRVGRSILVEDGPKANAIRSIEQHGNSPVSFRLDCQDLLRSKKGQESNILISGNSDSPVTGVATINDQISTKSFDEKSSHYNVVNQISKQATSNPSSSSEILRSELSSALSNSHRGQVLALLENIHQKQIQNHHTLLGNDTAYETQSNELSALNRSTILLRVPKRYGSFSMQTMYDTVNSSISHNASDCQVQSGPTSGNAYHTPLHVDRTSLDYHKYVQARRHESVQQKASIAHTWDSNSECREISSSMTNESKSTSRIPYITQTKNVRYTDNISDCGSYTPHRITKWHVDNSSLVAGSDLATFKHDSRQDDMSLVLREVSMPMLDDERLDIFLENQMAGVKRMALCYHHQGELVGYDLVPVEKIFELPGIHNTFPGVLQRRFSNDSHGANPLSIKTANRYESTRESQSKLTPESIRAQASELLDFIKSQCVQDNGSYWLFKDQDDSVIRLYSLSATTAQPLHRRRSMYMLAMLCFRFAKQLAIQISKLEQKLHHQKLSNAKLEQEKMINTIINTLQYKRQMLLKRCSNMLLQIHLDDDDQFQRSTTNGQPSTPEFGEEGHESPLSYGITDSQMTATPQSLHMHAVVNDELAVACIGNSIVNLQKRKLFNSSKAPDEEQIALFTSLREGMAATLSAMQLHAQHLQSALLESLANVLSTIDPHSVVAHDVEYISSQVLQSMPICDCIERLQCSRQNLFQITLLLARAEQLSSRSERAAAAIRDGLLLMCLPIAYFQHSVSSRILPRDADSLFDFGDDTDRISRSRLFPERSDVVPAVLFKINECIQYARRTATENTFDTSLYESSFATDLAIDESSDTPPEVFEWALLGGMGPVEETQKALINTLLSRLGEEFETVSTTKQMIRRGDLEFFVLDTTDLNKYNTTAIATANHTMSRSLINENRKRIARANRADAELFELLGDIFRTGISIDANANNKTLKHLLKLFQDVLCIERNSLSYTTIHHLLFQLWNKFMRDKSGSCVFSLMRSDLSDFEVHEKSEGITEFNAITCLEHTICCYERSIAIATNQFNLPAEGCRNHLIIGLGLEVNQRFEDRVIRRSLRKFGESLHCWAQDLQGANALNVHRELASKPFMQFTGTTDTVNASQTGLQWKLMPSCRLSVAAKYFALAADAFTLCGDVVNSAMARCNLAKLFQRTALQYPRPPKDSVQIQPIIQLESIIHTTTDQLHILSVAQAIAEAAKYSIQGKARHLRAAAEGHAHRPLRLQVYDAIAQQHLTAGAIVSEAIYFIISVLKASTLPSLALSAFSEHMESLHSDAEIHLARARSLYQEDGFVADFQYYDHAAACNYQSGMLHWTFGQFLVVIKADSNRTAKLLHVAARHHCRGAMLFKEAFRKFSSGEITPAQSHDGYLVMLNNVLRECVCLRSYERHMDTRSNVKKVAPDQVDSLRLDDLIFISHHRLHVSFTLKSLRALRQAVGFAYEEIPLVHSVQDTEVWQAIAKLFHVCLLNAKAQANEAKSSSGDLLQRLKDGYRTFLGASSNEQVDRAISQSINGIFHDR